MNKAIKIVYRRRYLPGYTIDSLLWRELLGVYQRQVSNNDLHGKLELIKVKTKMDCNTESKLLNIFLSSNWIYILKAC